MEADVDNTGLKRTSSAMLLKLNEINTFGANELQGVKPFVMYWISRVFRERFIPAYSRLTAICLNDLGKDLAHLFRSCPDQTISSVELSHGPLMAIPLCLKRRTKRERWQKKSFRNFSEQSR